MFAQPLRFGVPYYDGYNISFGNEMDVILSKSVLDLIDCS